MLAAEAGLQVRRKANVLNMRGPVVFRLADCDTQPVVEVVLRRFLRLFQRIGTEPVDDRYDKLHLHSDRIEDDCAPCLWAAAQSKETGIRKEDVSRHSRKSTAT